MGVSEARLMRVRLCTNLHQYIIPAVAIASCIHHPPLDIPKASEAEPKKQRVRVVFPSI